MHHRKTTQAAGLHILTMKHLDHRRQTVGQRATDGADGPGLRRLLSLRSSICDEVTGRPDGENRERFGVFGHGELSAVWNG
ncbi:unnamed protein product [Gadus morhua 'NCC']